MPYFHYCSTEAFFQIIKNRSIWLSSLTSSNDSMEGKWFSTVIAGLCDEEQMAPSEKQGLLAFVEATERTIDCIGFCTSTVRDALSQWRGYADDGGGVCIGFTSEFMKEVGRSSTSVFFQHVIYNLDEQRAHVRDSFGQMSRLIKEGALARPSRGSLLAPKSEDAYRREFAHYREKNGELYATVLVSAKKFFALKNPAFAEEREARLASMAIRPLEQLEYRVRAGRLVPYKPLDFPFAGAQAIQEVMLGPKNATPIDVVDGFLRRYGFEEVPVFVSSASYR